MAVFVVGELVHGMLLPEHAAPGGEPELLAAHLRERVASYLLAGS